MQIELDVLLEIDDNGQFICRPKASELEPTQMACLQLLVSLVDEQTKARVQACPDKKYHATLVSTFNLLGKEMSDQTNETPINGSAYTPDASAAAPADDTTTQAATAETSSMPATETTDATSAPAADAAPADDTSIIVGFRNALTSYHPEWETVWPRGRVEEARYFYLQALRDMTPWLNSAINGLQVTNQNMQNMSDSVALNKANVERMTADLAEGYNILQTMCGQVLHKDNAPADTDGTTPAATETAA